MMNRVVIFAAFLFFSCSNEPKTKAINKKEIKQELVSDTTKVYEGKGIGKFSNYEISSVLNERLANAGEKIYFSKCQSCHKLTNEKLIGPGLKDVTKRFKPEWVLNFITNTDEMLNKDEMAMELLKEANGARMIVASPVDEQEAKSLFEFMRKNDESK